MRVDTFDYDLPQALIAQEPANPRDSSRLMVLDRSRGTLEHRHFRDIGEYLSPGDCLVVNNTRVVPARLVGRRVATGGKWEGLFLKESSGDWELMLRTRGRPRAGERLVTENDLFELELREKTELGTWLVRPIGPGTTMELLEAAGHVPIPPYIRSGQDTPLDRERYQTVYAEDPGAVAAPTAGLHFTPSLLDRLRAQGIRTATVTLHVGPGTFQPVKVENTNEHAMHAEWCRLDVGTADILQQSRARGGRIVAVGTTSVRTLESAWQANGGLAPFQGETRLFLVPPHSFPAVDALVTNFHLPKSTLLMLVCAFAGTERVLDAYREAVLQGYRFYSYGDAMLIF